MLELIKALGESVVGVASGFDRIVFRGMVQPLTYAQGAMDFFSRRGVLYRDAREWVIAHTEQLVSAIDSWSRRECGESTSYLESSNIRKEEVARKRQAERGVESGLIGTWSCVEPATSYRLVGSEGAPRLRAVQTRCKHLYTYLDHPEFGFLSLRMQTWFPYRIQVAMNGREWLARQLRRAGVGFQRQGNKILQVDDLEVMQQLLTQQLATSWCELLDGFVPLAFPTKNQTLGPQLSYSWSLWQSEWASDLLFERPEDIEAVMDSLIRHAFIGAHPDRLLRYFGRGATQDGRPRRCMRDSLKTSVLDLEEGCRIRHWHGRNSVKMYNERNVLRIETTINDPGAFRVHRRKQGAPSDAPKHQMPLRKGVADTTLRAHVCQEVNDRLAGHLASTRCNKPLGQILALVTTSPKRRSKRRARALDPTGKDLAILQAIADPRFALDGMTNRDLRAVLAKTAAHAHKSDRQLSRWVTRALRLMRDHGLLRQMKRSRRYQLTPRGRSLTTAWQAALAADTQELTRMAA